MFGASFADLLRLGPTQRRAGCSKTPRRAHTDKQTRHQPIQPITFDRLQTNPHPRLTGQRSENKRKQRKVAKKKRRNKRCGDPTPAHCSEQCGGTARSSEATERLYVLLTDVCPSYVHLLQTERPPSRYLFFCLFYKLVILF